MLPKTKLKCFFGIRWRDSFFLFRTNYCLYKAIFWSDYYESHIKDLWTYSMLPISIVKAKYKYFQIQAFIILFRVKSILNKQAGVLPVFCYQTKVTDAYCSKKSWKTFQPIIKSSKIILVHIVYGLSSFS